jgi:hypothetical protein
MVSPTSIIAHTANRWTKIMPTYKVENNSARDKAIKVYGGSEVVKAGQSASVDNPQEFSDEQIEHYAAIGVVVTLAEKPKVDKPKMSKPESKFTKE